MAAIPIPLSIIAMTPAYHIEPSIAIAAVRAGHIGVLDLSFADPENPSTWDALKRLQELGRGDFGVKICGDARWFIERMPDYLQESLSLIISTPTERTELQRNVDQLRAKGRKNLRLFLEATNQTEADLGVAVGVDGIIVKGNESGGRVGEETTFILLQRLVSCIELPLYVQGGIGLHTIGAAYAAGAVGVVLDHQLALVRESALPESLKHVIKHMDSSDSLCLGEEVGQAYRVFSRRDRIDTERLTLKIAELAVTDSNVEATKIWNAELNNAISPYEPEESVWLIGQDAVFSVRLSEKYPTLYRLTEALLFAANKHMIAAREQQPLAPNAPLAMSHGTRYPIVQGPMTRVSDTPEFAAKVAENGALPFLALALMRAEQITPLLRHTREALAGRPWGVGMLGFIEPQLLQKQIETLRNNRPNFVLIAGGRPEQALVFEEMGIPAYLHVPSPELLRLFIDNGARRFIFEGRECGGHVGPRDSFVLWEEMIEVMLELVPAHQAAQYHILFAGGIHDALSASMVAVIAGALAEHGCRIGVLMGTAYTVTQEALDCGAVVAGFQEKALACDGTVTLESGPGHVTRCANTDFVSVFREEKGRLITTGEDPDHMRDVLERLNVGRLRIASKGVEREAERLISVDANYQSRKGLYMLGQLAALRHRIVSMAELHTDVSESATKRIESMMNLTKTSHSAFITPQPSELAIIGMGTILPKANDLGRYWENILDNVDTITEVPEDRWDWRRYFDPDRKARDKIYSKWGGFVSDVPFDPLHYGIPPNTLESIEPIHLLVLEAVRAALEDAGFKDGIIPDPELRRRTAVILGIGGGTGALGQRYAVRSFLPTLMGETPDWMLEQLPEWTEDSFPGVLINVTAGRVANRFDLGGVNFTVDAACGSSLAAVNLAVKELQSGSSDMVIVGGADSFQNPFDYVAFSKTQALSPRGKCHTFDADADGIAISEGVALVVLRRLSDAEREGSRIYALIQGCAGSSDGRDKSLTAPRPQGQAQALERAYSQAGIPIASIGLIEAHGTGTVVGDQAEVATLKKVFGDAGVDRKTCGLGSVKSMIGHTKAAAGSAGLIKVALALYHKVLPSTLNVTRPNPELSTPHTPFFLLDNSRPWITPVDQGTRRAGVSAFGFGGSNFHVVLEEYKGGFSPADRAPLRKNWPSELFLWGASSREELTTKLQNLTTSLQAGSRPKLKDLAHSLLFQFSSDAQLRLAIVAASHEELLERLQSTQARLSGRVDDRAGIQTLDPRGVYFCEGSERIQGSIAFLFPGQGSQYPQMLRELALYFPAARETIGTADRVLAQRLPDRLSNFIYPPTAYSDDEAAGQRKALTRTNVAQPAIGATSVAMLRILQDFGLKPEMVSGHSYGEYVALHSAGIMDEATLYHLSEVRGRSIIEAAGDDLGTMASVMAAPEVLQQHLEGFGEVQIANRNAPDMTVIAGPTEAVRQAVESLERKNISVRSIPVACGFHSACVAPARDLLANALAQAQLHRAQLPVFSNSTAAPYPEEPQQVLELLSQHLVNPVDFVGQVRAMYAAGARYFVEVGPNSVLTKLVGRILGEQPHLAVASDSSARSGLTQLQHLLGQLSVAGIPMNLEILFQGRDVRRIDPAMLPPDEGKPQYSATTCLVSGGNVRAHGAPKISMRDLPSSQLKPELPAKTAAATEGSSPSVTATKSASKPASVASPASLPAVNTKTDKVMVHYLELTRHMMETQQQVMLSYLHTRGSAATRYAASGNATATQANEPAAAHQQEQTAPATTVETSVAGAVSEQQITDVLLALVGDRTGYPKEMLDLDLNIEADLGIDSIKRTEIIGVFRKQLFPDGGEALTTAVERAIKEKSLRGIIGCFTELALTEQGCGTAPETRTDPGNRTNEYLLGPDAPRFVLTPTPTPAEAISFSCEHDSLFLITDDEYGVADRLATRLQKLGGRPVLLRMGDGFQQLDNKRFILDVTDPDAVRTLRDTVLNGHNAIGGIFHCLPLRYGSDFEKLDLASWLHELRIVVKSLFNLAMVFDTSLQDASHSFVVAASRLGGDMAIGGDCDQTPPVIHEGTSGLLKTFAKEWPNVRCKFLDFDLETDSSTLAASMLEEASRDDNQVEVGYRQGERLTFPARHQLLQSEPVDLDMDSSSVLLVTGGARGITAEVTLELAERYRPRLILCGSSPPPVEEEADIRDIAEPLALKKALIARGTGQPGKPDLSAVEETYRRILKNREIRSNIEALTQAGATVEYKQVDVRDENRFGVLIESVYTQYGHIDGVIHGAGIIEDKLIGDKSGESFDRVVETKAISSFILSRKLRPESLKFLVFFTSVAGRFGNRGQSDYAAVNEILSKMALYLDRQWPARVVAISWGPWDKTGMVSDEIKLQFSRLGIVPVPPELGRRALDLELQFGRKGDAEIIWGEGPWAGNYEGAVDPDRPSPQFPVPLSNRPH